MLTVRSYDCRWDLLREGRVFMFLLPWGRWREGNETKCSQFSGALYDKVEKKGLHVRIRKKKKSVQLLELGSSVNAYEREFGQVYLY